MAPLSIYPELIGERYDEACNVRIVGRCGGESELSTEGYILRRAASLHDDIDSRTGREVLVGYGAVRICDARQGHVRVGRLRNTRMGHLENGIRNTERNIDCQRTGRTDGRAGQVLYLGVGVARNKNVASRIHRNGRGVAAMQNNKPAAEIHIVTVNRIDGGKCRNR